MFPPEVDYRRASTLDDAVNALAAPDRDVRPVAGGHGLVPAMKAGRETPDELVDVSGLAMDGIEADGERVRIGALTTHRELAEASFPGGADVLTETAEVVGDLQVRNHGTLGGNLAEADPAADLPAAVVAADATFELHAPAGTRDVAAESFFHGDGRTDCASDELLTEVRVPLRPDAGGAYVKKTHPASGYAMVGVAAVVGAEEDGDGRVVTDARVAVVGATDRPTRLPSVEASFVGSDGGDDAANAAAEDAGDDVEPERRRGDHHASADFRANVLPAYTARALSRAAARARGGSDDE